MSTKWRLARLYLVPNFLLLDIQTHIDTHAGSETDRQTYTETRSVGIRYWTWTAIIGSAGVASRRRLLRHCVQRARS